MINLKHFNHLYTEIEIKNKKMGVVHIYSNAPNYSYAIEPSEGFTCVDDVSRAIIMLSNQLKFQHDSELLKKLKLMVEFVLYMQNKNGYFNNFLWPDLTINTDYKTSIAEMNWWSFRALWSLQVAEKNIRDDKELRLRVDYAIDKMIANIKKKFLITAKLSTVIVNNITLPTWLPHRYASDQAALAIISLLPYYKNKKDPKILHIINTLAKGIMLMQKGDKNHYPYGMFLSWKNQWHAWGNNQAYALLLAGQQLNKPEYIKSALLEIDNFYPYLLKNGFAEEIFIKRNSNTYSEQSRQSFPQIAYGLRPMVYATAEAFKITHNTKYSILLTTLKSWLFAKNDAKKVMYDKNSGRTYDGIISAKEINLNSGAESTIETLLILQKY